MLDSLRRAYFKDLCAYTESNCACLFLLYKMYNPSIWNLCNIYTCILGEIAVYCSDVIDLAVLHSLTY